MSTAINTVTREALKEKEYLSDLSEFYPYQKKWVKLINSKDRKNRFNIIYGPTGSGKTTTISKIIKRKDLLLNSFISLTIPQDSQEVLVNLMRNLESVNNIIFLMSEEFSKKMIREGLFNFNIFILDNGISDVQWNRINSHNKIVFVGSNDAFINKFIPYANFSILNERILIGLIDEVQKEVHTYDKDSYAENTENPSSGFSSKKVDMVNFMLSNNFSLFGFSGTPSLQQEGKLAKKGYFDFHGLAANDLKFIQSKNSFLEGVYFLRGDNDINNDKIIAEELFPDNDLVSEEKRLYLTFERQLTLEKKLLKNIKEVHLTRPGRVIISLGNDNQNLTEGVITSDTFEKFIAPELEENSYVYWFGLTNYYMGKPVREGIDSFLDSHPEVKLIVTKQKLKTGFDRSDINGIIFARKVNKVIALMNEEQFIGRGVRASNIGLIITFTSVSEDEDSNEKHLIERILERGTILKREDYNNLVVPEFKESKNCLANSSDIFKDIIHKNMDKFHRTLKKISDRNREDYEDNNRYDYEKQKISGDISSVYENIFGDKKVAHKTAGMLPEDGFIYDKERGFSQAYDIKVSCMNIENSSMYGDNWKNRSITLKEDIKSNMIFVLFCVSIIDNEIKLDDIYLFNFSEEKLKQYSLENKSTKIVPLNTIKTFGDRVIKC